MGWNLSAVVTAGGLLAVLAIIGAVFVLVGFGWNHVADLLREAGLNVGGGDALVFLGVLMLLAVLIIYIAKK